MKETYNPTTTNNMYLTIIIITAMPDKILGSLFLGGKCGSFTPVTGFFSYVGALAQYSGLGRSCNRFIIQLFLIISTPGQSPGRAIVLPPASALVSVLAAALALAKC